MKYLSVFWRTLLISLMCLTLITTSAEAARDVQNELQQIKKQRQFAQQEQKRLSTELGAVGKNLKQLDLKLLKARKDYRDVRKEITSVDKRLKKLVAEKNSLKDKMHILTQQMLKEASVAYRNSGTRSVWVDILSGTSITDIPHRQFLLKSAMLSQENDRKAWRKSMEKLARVEAAETKTKQNLLTLKQERKDAENALVTVITDKKHAAKQLRSDLKKTKAQDKRLARQAQALQRLLDGLGDTLLASDKKSKTSSIRKQKGKLAWPIQGRVLVGFKQKTNTGVKLAGVHISPQRRTEAGKLVHALGQGQVRYADWFGGYGLMMIVDYGHGIMAVYAHNDALHKQLGDWVEHDEVLAEAGSTGWIEDVRLYFEIRDKGKPVNPSRWCKK